MKEIDVVELSEMFPGNEKIFSMWLERGDGVAVYTNQAMDSSNLGHQYALSYGGPNAQINGDPPKMLPINVSTRWAYVLTHAVKRREVEEE